MDDNARFCPQCGCPAEEDVNVSASKGEAKEQKEENRNLPSEAILESNDKNNKTFVIFLVVAVVVAVAVGFSLLFAPLPVSTGVYSAPSDTADSDSTMVVTDCTSADSTVLEESNYTDEAGSNDAYVANESEKSATTGNSYAFEFVVSGTTYRITFNKQEKTAQLYVKGDLVPNGKTFYGYCQLDGLYHKGQIEVSGFDGASDFNILRGNERASWSAGIWIDYKNNYLYITQDAARAYNPDYRIAITPVK